MSDVSNCFHSPVFWGTSHFFCFCYSLVRFADLLCWLHLPRVPRTSPRPWIFNNNRCIFNEYFPVKLIFGNITVKLKLKFGISALERDLVSFFGSIRFNFFRSFFLFFSISFLFIALKWFSKMDLWNTIEEGPGAPRIHMQKEKKREKKNIYHKNRSDIHLLQFFNNKWTRSINAQWIEFGTEFGTTSKANIIECHRF